jgi:hypothetical protein
VCSKCANTGWLNFSRSRNRLISAALNARTGGGQIASNCVTLACPSWQTRAGRCSDHESGPSERSGTRRSCRYRDGPQASPEVDAAAVTSAVAQRETFVRSDYLSQLLEPPHPFL